MNALLEFSPLLAFIVAYYLRDIYVATATLMVAMGLLLLADWLLTRRIPRMHLISTALVLVFGSATLILRSPVFIQWKPTIFMWLLAVAFLVSGFIGKQTLAQRLLQPALGTDTAGSVRIPAATCGLIGLKTTHGAVSTEGCVPLAPSLDSVGVLSRYAEDARQIWQAICPQAPHSNVQQSQTVGDWRCR
jgi:hypothetical protein